MPDLRVFEEAHDARRSAFTRTDCSFVTVTKRCQRLSL
jgi:hypothetical protein